MKFLTLTAATLFLFSFSKDDANTSSLKTDYHYQKGILNGKFTTWYDNGKKRAEGHFEQNQKTGTWSVWSEEGQLLTQRNYQHSFDFSIEVVNDKTGKTLPIPTKNTYNLSYNPKGYIDYPELEESHIVWLKRIWRTIEPSPLNGVFFNQDHLFHTLKENMLSGSISAYHAESDEMRTVLTPEQVEDIFSSTTQKIVAYRLKEERFYNKKTMTTEDRIIGLCPITSDQSALFWVYFPEIRAQLAAQKISTDLTSIPVNSLDDIFFFRQFNSQIYKESNYHDREIADYKKGEEIAKEAESIEINMQLLELRSWVSQ